MRTSLGSSPLKRLVRRLPTPPGDRRNIFFWIAVGSAVGVVLVSTLAPTLLDPWIQIALLAVLAACAVALQWSTDRAAQRDRHLIGPLTLFVLAFILVTAPRAIELAAGGEGRYFQVSGGQTRTIFDARLRRDEPERSMPAGAALEGAARRGGVPTSVGGDVRTIHDQAYLGDAAISVVARPDRDLRYLALQLPGPLGPTSAVADGEPVAGSVAVRPRSRLPNGTTVQLYVRFFDADGRFLRDRLLAGVGVETLAQPGWHRLDGWATTHGRGQSAGLVVLVRPVSATRRSAILVDAPVVISGERSTEGFVGPPGGRSSWADALSRGMAASLALLGAVLLGYVLGPKTTILRRLPELRLPSLGERGPRLLAVVLLGVGVAAYVAEMWTYGGYGGYLDSLAEIGVAGLGKWYLHALALLPTGIAVMVVARRIALREPTAWTATELIIVSVGALIALSYWLKTAIAIPLLTILLLALFNRRRAALWAGLLLGGLVAAAPFVYLVRLRGKIDPGPLFTSSYWSDFGSTLSSRFFHLESTMIAIPHGASEHPWQPVVDFFVGLVPRTFWEGKPLSASARFTHDHLLSHLYAGTDVGVISLPGELWLVGGAVGLVVGGILVGLGLRLAHTLIAARSNEAGTLLVAATLTTGLIFLIDGWGVASAVTVLLITAAGWLVFIRPVRRV
jgi:hypothetical protein